MEILEKLFGNANKVKVMRLFLFNTDTAYTLTDISERSKSKIKDIKKEIQLLINIGLIKKKSIVRELHQKKGKKIVIKKINDTGYILETKFPYLQSLKNLLITASLHADDSLVKKFGVAGKMKLFLASGLFIQQWDSRVDLLIVGDELNINKLEIVIKNIESEIGKEITYSVFDTSDFEYRLGIHDKLIRDILDTPHIILVDKLGILNK